MVPNLDEFPWIEAVPVADSELAAEGAVLVSTRRSSETFTWFSRRIDRPEAEAVLLAKRQSAPLVIEDHKGVRCAADFGVAVVKVVDLLLTLEQAGLIPNAQESAARILATGYHSRELWWLSMGIRPAT